jgi:hypothetical protein
VLLNLQGYISETDDYLEERYKEGRDAVSLLERMRSGDGNGGGQQQQQHSSSGGGSIPGGRKQVTRRRIAAIYARDNQQQPWLS